MSGTARMNIVASPGSRYEPFARPVRKIALLAAEDSYVLDRGQALLPVLADLAREIVVVARSTGRLPEFEAVGAGVIDFDCRVSWRNPLRDARTAWRLARILEAEGADVTHVIGVGPAMLVGLALKLVAAKYVVLHLPDLDALVSPSGAYSWLYRSLGWKALASLVRRPHTFLLVENPSTLASLRAHGVEPSARFAVLGGRGVDPDSYPVLPPPANEMPVAAFVGGMTRSSGLDVLMRAFDRLWARGLRLKLELVEARGFETSDAIAADQLTLWGLQPGVHIPGPVADVREVWRRAEICVLPALGQQGTPGALLEAAACGRALIVTEGSGGGSFVRDGVEGLVVPRGDANALAEALERLARDGALRSRLGEGARLRVLQGFTEAHVKQALTASYVSLLGRAAG